MPHSTVNIKIDRDGGVVVYTGASDIGQGSDTMVAQIASEVLGCSMARVKVIAADTDLTPIDIGSYSSRVTFMNGNATLRAAQDVKKQIALGRGEEDELRARRSRLPRGQGCPKDLPSRITVAPSTRGSVGLGPRRRADSSRVAAAEAQR